jgi:hypothetical protein
MSLRENWLAQRWSATRSVPGPAWGLPWMTNEGFQISEASLTHGKPGQANRR